MIHRAIVIVTTLIALASTTPGRAEEVKLLSDAVNASARLINIDQTQGVGQQAAAMKEAECLRAFGQPALCACLAGSLSVQVSLQDYVRVAGMSAGELHERRKGLSPEEQQLIDRILASRTQCVAPLRTP